MGGGIVLILVTAPAVIGVLIGRLVGKSTRVPSKGVGQLTVIVFGMSVAYGAVTAFPLHGGAIGDAAANLHAFGPDGAQNEIYDQIFSTFLVMGLCAAMSFSWFNRRKLKDI